MAIYLMEPHMAELIAAGEVVERPASVVKELVENAIDAGATSVTVEIERGGIGLIRVEDNGGGIEKNDIPLAFVRHATSKVRVEQDLDAIHTLGFRGEALASVASVARVQLLTKSTAEPHAWAYTVQGGAAGEIVEAARPGGTTITVQDLFYNTPARMKFLKKDSSEGTFVAETMGRLALSRADTAFRFVREGKQVFATPGDGRLESAVYSVLGSAFAKELLPVAGDSGPYAVQGLVSRPTAGRASRSMQYFFVNGRFVKNRTVMAALEQAYRGLMMGGRYPGAVLFVTLPAELVDVNVHPAKTEVRFAREQDVFDTVYRAVKGAVLGGQTDARMFDMKVAEAGGATQESPMQAVVAEGAAKSNNVPDDMNSVAQSSGWLPKQQNDEDATLQPVEVRPPLGEAGQAPALNRQFGQPQEDGVLQSTGAVAYQTAVRPAPYGAARPPYAGTPPQPEWGLDITPDEDEDVQPLRAPTEQPKQAAQVVQQSVLPQDGIQLRLVGEVFKTYIVAEGDGALVLIDKHAAHERLLYEKIAASRGNVDSQQLLAPVNVLLSAAEKEALLQNREVLSDAGFEVEDFGGAAVAVRGVPADIELPDVEGLVTEVAARMATNARDAAHSKLEWVLHSIACRAAIKAGDSTPPQQLLRLAQDILSGTVPKFCPHGRPVVLNLTKKELERQFGRLG